MDRLASLFEQLTLPEIAQLLRRTALSALGIGIVALAVGVLLSHPLAGLGVLAGLGLGLVNIRLITRSVARLSAAEVEKPRRILVSRSLGRLSMTTIIVIGLMFASAQLGLGTFAGIAAFYFVLIVNVAKSLLHPKQPRLSA